MGRNHFHRLSLIKKESLKGGKMEWKVLTLKDLEKKPVLNRTGTANLENCQEYKYFLEAIKSTGEDIDRYIKLFEKMEFTKVDGDHGDEFGITGTNEGLEITILCEEIYKVGVVILRVLGYGKKNVHDFHFQYVFAGVKD